MMGCIKAVVFYIPVLSEWTFFYRNHEQVIIHSPTCLELFSYLETERKMTWNLYYSAISLPNAKNSHTHWDNCNHFLVQMPLFFRCLHWKFLSLPDDYHFRLKDRQMFLNNDQFCWDFREVNDACAAKAPRFKGMLISALAILKLKPECFRKPHQRRSYVLG